MKRGRPKKIKPIVEEIKNDSIRASLKIMGKIFEASGNTVQEAIGRIDIGSMKGTGVLVLKKGNIVKEKILSVNRVVMAFGKMGQTRKEIMMKQICGLFSKEIFE